MHGGLRRVNATVIGNKILCQISIRAITPVRAEDIIEVQISIITPGRQALFLFFLFPISENTFLVTPVKYLPM
jgi:hypothetical protein